MRSNPFDFATSTTLGAYCLLATHREHSDRRNFLLTDRNKQAVNPQTGQELLIDSDDTDNVSAVLIEADERRSVVDISHFWAF
jgi:hypothetical protein